MPRKIREFKAQLSKKGFIYLAKRKLMNQYSMIIQWSDEDRLFLVTISEFSDRVIMPCTHGIIRQEAIIKGEDAIKMYLEACREEGEVIPQPSKLQTA